MQRAKFWSWKSLCATGRGLQLVIIAFVLLVVGSAVLEVGSFIAHPAAMAAKLHK